MSSPSPHSPHTALFLALVDSLQCKDPLMRQTALLALDQMGEDGIIKALVGRMLSGSPEEAWEAIRVMSIVMESRSAAQAGDIAEMMQERIDLLGEKPSSGREAFVRLALMRLKKLSIEIHERKERGRSIMSEGKPKPPKVRRAAPKPLRRASSTKLRRLHRERVVVPRLNNR